MRSTLAVALGGAVGLTVARPSLLRRQVASFPAGQSWDIILNKENVDLNNLAATEIAESSVIDIDLFDNDGTTISALKEQGKQVICYFSAGSREDWRDDSSRFTASDYGQGLDGWKGENWVNVKSTNVRNIMKDRIALAAKKGCAAVDPDNVDGFGNNQDGFGYDQSAYADYVKFLAKEASAQNLAIGLKNALDLIPDVIDVVQFAVNEQCHEYNECDKYKPFADANKAVFAIEYGSNDCSQPDGTKLSILLKPEDQALNTFGGACDASSDGVKPAPSASAPAASAPAASSPAASAPASSAPATHAPTPVQTPAPSSAPAATPTSGAVQPSPSATEPETTAAPTPGTGYEEGDEDEDEGDDEDENEDDEEDEDDEDEEDDEEQEDNHSGRPWWQGYYKHN